MNFVTDDIIDFNSQLNDDVPPYDSLNYKTNQNDVDSIWSDYFIKSIVL